MAETVSDERNKGATGKEISAGKLEGYQTATFCVEEADSMNLMQWDFLQAYVCQHIFGQRAIVYGKRKGEFTDFAHQDRRDQQLDKEQLFQGWDEDPR